MPSRLQISEELIDRADRLLGRIEAAGPSCSQREFVGCLKEVEKLLGARQAGLSLFDGKTIICLAGESTDAPATLIADKQTGEDAVHRIEQASSTSMLITRSIGAECRLMLEAVFDSPGQCAELDDLFIAIADAFALVVNSQRLSQLENAHKIRQDLNAYCRSLHATRDARLLASQIATDGAAVMGVDRVSVIRRRNSKADVLAVTGVADVNDRANETRFLRTIVEQFNSDIPATWKTSDQLARESGCTDIAPTPTRNVRVVCDDAVDREAVFVLECFDEPPTDSSIQTEVLAHASLAIANAWELNARGAAGFMRRVTHSIRSRGTLFFLTILTAIVLALTLIPATFEITCRGNLQPVEQQFVLAPSHGTVIFAAENEQKLQAGDPVITLHNAQLELEESRIRGELRTAEAKLQSLQADRGNSTNARLTSEAEVHEQIVGLKRQLQILQKELQVLHVTARFDGTVYRNDLAHDLLRTTVQPGQPIMHLVNPSSEWQVQLRIPDKMIRHVLQADRNVEDTLPIRMMLRTDPSVVLEGRVSSIGSASDIDFRNELTVPATAAFQSDSNIELRPGAEVLARIDCGQRSLGFVLFRDVVEFVQSRILF